MRTLGKRFGWVFLVLITTGGTAVSHDHDNWRGNREAAYRSGYDHGFRDGLRHGAFDYQAGIRYGYRGRDHLSSDGYFGYVPVPDGHYRKGYRDGYRDGYGKGYRPRHFPRPTYPQQRGFYYFR